MRRNPRDDWTIDHVAKVCAQHGVELEPPSNGSHYKAISCHLAGHLTIPKRKPVKAVYIKNLVSMIDTHLQVIEGMKGEK